MGRTVLPFVIFFGEFDVQGVAQMWPWSPLFDVLELAVTIEQEELMRETLARVLIANFEDSVVRLNKEVM